MSFRQARPAGQVSRGQAFAPLSLFLVLVLSLAVAGCAGRPSEGALALSPDGAPGAEVHDMLVVTTRARSDRPDTYFDGERADTLDYAEIGISVPPSHVSGAIEWPKKAPGDPEKEFVARSAAYIDGKAAFSKRLDQRLAQLPKGKRTVFIFIHGYNTLFAEGLYRFTQMVHDGEFPGVPVLFTWASRGQVQDYLYDLNSAAIARDALQEAVGQILNSRADNVVIMAHSMGNWLLMEAARQIPPEARKRLDAKVSQVILAAPDIDIDVFKTQLRRLGKLHKPFVVIVSRDDRALLVSRKLAGGKERVGAYSNDDELAELGATVIDLTDVEAQDGAHHSKFAQLAQFGPELRAVLLQPELVRETPQTAGGLAQTTGATLGGFIGGVIDLPIAVVTGQVR